MTRKTSLVPKELYNFLDHTTASLFLRDPYMCGFVEKTYASGIQRIGILVQMTEDEVFHRAPTSPSNKAKLKEELVAAGLAFGMKAPGWKNPNRRRAQPKRSKSRTTTGERRNGASSHR